MWNCDWEYENQETLRQWYEEKISGADPDSTVRRIICKGCGRIFYTQISTKKYCYYYLCGNRGYQKDLKQRRLEKRQNRICKGCGKPLLPSGRMRSTAATPAGSGRIARVLRIEPVFKLNTTSNRNTEKQSVTDNGGGQKDHLLIRNTNTKKCYD